MNPRSRSLRYFLIVAVGVSIAAGLVVLSHGARVPADAQAPDPTRVGKPLDDATPSTSPTNKDDWADEVPIAAESAHACPLTADGCEAVEAVLALIDHGQFEDVITSLAPKYPIGPKPGRSIVDEKGLLEALSFVRGTSGAVAIGCPQENVLGPEVGACADLFVLAVDAFPDDSLALAFIFTRQEDRFAMEKAVTESGFVLTRGGGAATIALPRELTKDKSALWYTPWVR